MSKIVQFEPFKHAKEWEEEYPKFLGNIEKHFGTKTDPESMAKRLYYAMRWLDGVFNSFWIFSLMGIDINAKEIEKGKKYCIDWLQDIIDRLKS
jgi:hypothetical protein